MTKKDYIAFANILNNYRRYFLHENCSGCIEKQGSFNSLVDAVSYYMKQDNNRFSKDRFVAAVYTTSVRGSKTLL